MQFSIKSPSLSFVQIEEYTQTVVCGEESVQLPFTLADDLKFQLLIETETIDDATLLMGIPITNFELLLINGGPSINQANIIANTFIFYNSLNKHFQRYRIGLKTVLLYWSHGLPSFDTHISCEQCFKMALAVKINATTTVVPTNHFYRSCDSCYTSVLEYYCDENSYGFNYCQSDLPNRVRLPLVVSRPQFVDEESIYMKSDGSIKMLKSVTKEEFEGKVDYLDKHYHERVKVALSHDNVNMESDHYNGGLRKQGGYEIEWVDFMMHSVAPAKFKALATPYLVRNNNCETCEVIDLNCPIISNITSNVGATLDAALLSYIFNWNPLPTPQVTSILIRYRLQGATSWISVTSTNISNFVIELAPGTYEFSFAANGETCIPIYSAITTVIGVAGGNACTQPTELTLITNSLDFISFSWFRILPVPAGGYDWVLRQVAGGIEASGNGYLSVGTPVILDINGLSLLPSTDYEFTVRTNCGGGSYSLTTHQIFTTP